MTRRKTLQRTVALLLCVFLCLGAAFSMMGAANAANAEPSASGVTIEIMLPVDWASTSAAARVCVTDDTGGGFASVEARIDRDGSWRNITAGLERRDNRYYGVIDITSNCTIYVRVTGYDGEVYENSRYMECFDRTAPTLRASIDGRLLRAEASDDLSGVTAIYIDGEKYDDLTNGTLDVPLRDLPGDYEQLSVQAVDAAGNKSKIVQIKNPNYQAEDKKQESSTTPTQTQPPATTTPVTSTTPATTTPTTSTTPPTTQATAPATSTTKLSASTGSTKSSASASTDPDEEPDTTPRDPVPLTPDGQATVLDNATGEDGKEFYTIQTPDENVFYLIIDNQRDTENVYFLNAVTEADLMALAVKGDDTTQTEAIPDPEPVCTCKEQCVSGEVNTDCPVCILNPKDCTGKPPVTDTETDTEPEEKEKGSGGVSAGTLILVLLAALAAGGAGYYFKIYKPKKDLDDADDFDELTGEDEEETVNEDEEADAQEPAIYKESDTDTTADAYGDSDAYQEPDEPDYPEDYGGEDE